VVNFRAVFPLPFEDTHGDRSSRDDMSSVTAWNIFSTEVVHTHSQKLQMYPGAMFGYLKERLKQPDE
jgi:hypothetical protein